VARKSKKERLAAQRQRRRKKRRQRRAPWEALTDEGWERTLREKLDAPAALERYFSGWLDDHVEALDLDWARATLHLLHCCDDDDGALAIYDQRLADAPRCALVEYEVGQFASDVEGDLLRAKRHLLAAVALAPQLAAIHYALGQLYHRLGAAERAVSAFHRAAALAGDDEAEIAARASFNVGASLANAGRAEEAIPLFEHALERMPDYPEALQALTQLSRPGALAELRRRFKALMEGP